MKRIRNFRDATGLNPCPQRDRGATPLPTRETKNAKFKKQNAKLILELLV
jgi:hypothetical protein